MNFGVIGLGQMGTYYLKKLQVYGVTKKEIFGCDVDPKKVSVATEAFPGIQFDTECQKQIDAAIVAVNTPAHARVIHELMGLGARTILVEKPLGFSLEEVNGLFVPMETSGTRIYTAFLMNFSPAILHVMELMRQEDLVLVEGSVLWGKNRFGDSRPTPGDLEDELVHGTGILHTLASVNQEIITVDVAGQLTYPSFADESVQENARALDPSFPEHVNASSMVLERVTTNVTTVMNVLHSSFIYPHQVRKVAGVLGLSKCPSDVRYSVEFTFDGMEDGKVVDTLTMTTLKGNQVTSLSFPVDKLGDQTEAFIKVARGEPADERLTDYAEARTHVAFTETVMKSSQAGGRWLRAFSKNDIKKLWVA